MVRSNGSRWHPLPITPNILDVLATYWPCDRSWSVHPNMPQYDRSDLLRLLWMGRADLTAWPLSMPGHTNLLPMNNLFRGLLAGGAAYKWGGGCVGTVLVFVIVYMLLGSC